MATIVRSDNFFEITGIAADLTAREIFGTDASLKDIKVKRIEFVAGANNDVCVIKHGSGSAATICVLATPDVEIVDRVYFGESGQYMLPFVDFGDGVFNAGHKLVIEVA